MRTLHGPPFCMLKFPFLSVPVILSHLDICSSLTNVHHHTIMMPKCEHNPNERDPNKLHAKANQHKSVPLFQLHESNVAIQSADDPERTQNFWPAKGLLLSLR